MQVQRIQNNNTAFCAKLNIIGGKLDKETIAVLSKNAEKIGSENDVVELNFSKIFSNLCRHDYHTYQDKSLINYMYNQFRQILNAKFIPNGNGKCTEEITDKIYALELEDVLQNQKNYAEKCLDKLSAKLGIN